MGWIYKEPGLGLRSELAQALEPQASVARAEGSAGTAGSLLHSDWVKRRHLIESSGPRLSSGPQYVLAGKDGLVPPSYLSWESSLRNSQKCSGNSRS